MADLTPSTMTKRSREAYDEDNVKQNQADANGNEDSKGLTQSSQLQNMAC